MEILRQLLFYPDSRFTDLNISELTSDHFTYHIKGLIMMKLVLKGQNGRYTLTSKGKELANSMDTDKIIIEKQPKVAVMLIIEKMVDGEKNILVQTRLKEPYFGYRGCPTGKVRYGEKILEAGARELKEETDLEATLELKCIVHEIVYAKESGNLLEDKIFHIIRGSDPVGEIKNFEGGSNEWLPLSKYFQIEVRFKVDDDIFETYENPKQFYREKEFITEQF